MADDRGIVVGSRRRNAVALISALVLVAVSVWIVQKIRTSDNPVNLATVYAAYLGVATLLVSLLASLLSWWWKGRRTPAVSTAAQLTAAADHFAQRMLDTWRREAKARGISTPAPVRVRWQWGPAEVTPPLAEVITVPVIGTGPRPLPEPNPAEPNSDPPGVLLEAGVVTRLHEEVYCRLPHGRLVLLGGPGAGKTGAMILLLLAALDHRHNVPEARRVEVPVPVWLTLGGWDPTTQTLRQWVAATIDRDHSYLRAPEYGLDAAGELFSAGRVALFLDGLDEMAPSAQGKALARIDQEGAGLRIVLSCRPDEYRQALSEDRLHNTAVIEVQQVDPEAARAYLLHDQVGYQHDRWAQVGEYLIHHPDSVAAHALNNPLTLSLARATYQDQDPTPLTNPTEFPTVAALREHLIERSLITAYPDEDQRAHATRWLAWIAHHMGSERDLAWWHIPAWIPRWQLRRVGGLTSEVGKEPQTIFPRLPRPREISKLLAGGFAGGLAFGLAGGLAFGLAGGLAFGLAGGLAGGLTALLDLWTVPLPRTATATPAARYWIVVSRVCSRAGRCPRSVSSNSLSSPPELAE
ncbi:MAG: NACHT domain-containing protein [Pseudonocardiaceae bacterium]